MEFKVDWSEMVLAITEDGEYHSGIETTKHDKFENNKEDKKDGGMSHKPNRIKVSEINF